MYDVISMNKGLSELRITMIWIVDDYSHKEMALRKLVG